MAKQNPSKYHFTCKNCGHEYIASEPIWNCPECGTQNQTDGKI